LTFDLQFEDPLEQGKPDVLRREIRVGDTNTAFILKLFDLSPNVFDPRVMRRPPVLDVSAIGGGLQMVFSRPDYPAGTSNPPAVVTATFATISPALDGQTGDGTDGLIEYLTPSGFLDVPGLWRVQGLVSLPPGAWASQIRTFRVFENLPTS